MKYIATVNGNDYDIEIIDEGSLILNGRLYQVDFKFIGEQPIYSLLVEGKSYEAYVYPNDKDLEVLILGRLYPVRVIDEHEKYLHESISNNIVERGDFILKAPMPGSIVSLLVRDGQNINKGDVLVILESMKMQNELRSPRSGMVSRVKIKQGDHVDQKQILLSVV